MADALKLNILTPEREFYSGEVTEIITESTRGSIGILANHMPLVTTLRPNVTEITEKNGNKFKAFISSGIMEVKDNEVKILCDVCESPEEIDFRRAEEAKKRAEERLKDKNQDNLDVVRAELALSRALARLKLK
ncbi:F0F1 ATP synthase subunit epsilon [Clostridium thailandense]|uniref:ATP synthase epsilon chain n=1 Tax=Clostridium thailandense TaxID=2794346 RepID=A0A949TVQ5_9CLOT|nr:F0F1 ATP synthase subunit epsilon [Clostridium thailandense]MBV7272335.1 F0F1 ATP synthase subunit epsilon [Clostridium thailandense]MCH5135952.1 F0F1 ATP synthase subunit epsilon [Clostridiaceae bacterium UIB06]